MSGTLILKAGGSAKRTVLVWLLAALLSALIVLSLATHLPLEGMSRAAVLALVAYAVLRAIYRVFDTSLTRKDQVNEVRWSLTDTDLTLGEDVIPRESIKTVHCWPNRDTLGFTLSGWTVNIETSGKNHVLRTLTEGDRMDESESALRDLVDALGYGYNWRS